MPTPQKALFVRSKEGRSGQKEQQGYGFALSNLCHSISKKPTTPNFGVGRGKARGRDLALHTDKSHAKLQSNMGGREGMAVGVEGRGGREVQSLFGIVATIKSNQVSVWRRLSPSKRCVRE